MLGDLVGGLGEEDGVGIGDGGGEIGGVEGACEGGVKGEGAAAGGMGEEAIVLTVGVGGGVESSEVNMVAGVGVEGGGDKDGRNSGFGSGQMLMLIVGHMQGKC